MKNHSDIKIIRAAIATTCVFIIFTACSLVYARTNGHNAICDSNTTIASCDVQENAAVPEIDAKTAVLQENRTGEKTTKTTVASVAKTNVTTGSTVQSEQTTCDNADTSKPVLQSTTNTAVDSTTNSNLPSRVGSTKSLKEDEIEEHTTKKAKTIVPSGSLLEIEMFNSINKYRMANGLDALKWSNAAASAASTRSGEIKTYFSHTRPNGKSFSTVYPSSDKMVGVRAGENLLSGGPANVDVMMNAFKDSPTHNENLLKEKWNYVGISISYDPNTNSYCCAQEFLTDDPFI